MLSLAVCQELRGDVENLCAVRACPLAAMMLSPQVQCQPFLAQETLVALLAVEAGVLVLVSQVLVVRLRTLHLLVAQLAHGVTQSALFSGGLLWLFGL